MRARLGEFGAESAVKGWRTNPIDHDSDDHAPSRQALELFADTLPERIVVKDVGFEIHALLSRRQVLFESVEILLAAVKNPFGTPCFDRRHLSHHS